MQTLAQVKAQIARLPEDGRYIFWTHKEIRALPQILENDEVIYAVTSGFVEKSTWLLVCTDRRLIFMDRGFFFGLKQIQMPLNRINSIDHEIGMAFGNIAVWDGATRVSIGGILRSKVAYFVRVAKKAMENYNLKMSGQFQQQQMQQQAYQQQPAAPQKPELSPEERARKLDALSEHLEKLAALRDKGILSEAEFQEQKAKMLAGL